jgi:hypothetical protein
MWLLPAAGAVRSARLDVRGLVLLSGGIASFLYGLARIGSGQAGGGALPLALIGAGLALIAAFCAHALRASNPLLDIRLFAVRGFAAAAITNVMLGMALFGAALLLPLHSKSSAAAARWKPGCC